MTVNEVVKCVIKALKPIRVPTEEIHSIGVPIANAISDLEKCVAFMDHLEQEQREKAEREAAEKAEAEAAAAAEDAEQVEKPDADPEAVATAPEKDPDARPADDTEDLFGEKEQEGGGRG